MNVAREGIDWECGEPIYLAGVDERGEKWSLFARVWDAGPFDGYCVIRSSGACEKVVVDLPEYDVPFAGQSSGVVVRNMAREAELLGMRQ